MGGGRLGFCPAAPPVALVTPSTPFSATPLLCPPPPPLLLEHTTAITKYDDSAVAPARAYEVGAGVKNVGAGVTSSPKMTSAT